MRSRYARLRAEHATTHFSPWARVSRIHLAIASSHGQRSASVSATLARIFATFAAAWNASPSAKRQPRRSARARATVVLPLPDTPMTTMTDGTIDRIIAEEPHADRVRRAGPHGRQHGA